MAFDLGTLIDQNQPTGNFQAFTPSSVNMADYNQGAIKQLPNPSGGGIGAIPGEILNVGKTVGGALVNSVVGGVKGLYGQITGNDLQPHIATFNALTQQQSDLAKSYKTGKISKSDYQAGLKDLQGKFSDLSNQFHQYNTDYRKNFAKNEGQVALTLATLLAPEARAAELGGEGLLAAGANRALAAGGDLLGAGKAATAANKFTQVGGSLARNALAVQPTAEVAGTSVNDLAHGDIAGAAGNAALLLAPAAAMKIAPVIRSGAAAAGGKVFGKAAILNQIFNPSDVAALTGNDLTAAKQIEQYTLNQPGVRGDITKAAPYLTTHLMGEMGINPSSPTALQDLIHNWQQYYPKTQAVAKLITQGKLPATAVVSHDFKGQIDAIVNGLKDIPAGRSYMGHLDQVQSLVDNLNITNTTLRNKLINAIVQSTPEDLKTNLQALAKQQTLKDLGNGYIATYGPKNTAEVPTADSVAANELIKGSAPSKLGQKITAAGLSPRAVAPGDIRATLERNFQQRLQEAGINHDAKSLLSALEARMKTAFGVSDARMLSNHQVEEALQRVAPEATPGVIAKALRQAYADLPASMVGAGGKLVNKVMNPLLAKYLRVQQIGRFQNPVFTYGRVPVKGAIVALAEGAKPSSLITGGSKETDMLLKQEGWLGAATSAGNSGTTSDELAGVVGGGKIVNAPLRRQITGLAESVAAANHTTVADILQEKGALYNQLQHSISLIKGYGTSGYLNSPLAKTLNLIIFPSRFDTKVIMEAGKLFARMKPADQIATVSAVANMSQFLSSPQGKQWQKDNAELLSVISYFSPTSTIQNFINFFKKGAHVQDLGELGGLPFGVISTILEHQGVNLGKLGGSQYVDPKTGQPVPDKIPTTDKARMQQGATDLISSMFDWPGKSVGLTSKTNLVQTSIPLLKESPDSYKYELQNGQPAPSNLGVKQVPQAPVLLPITPLTPAKQSPTIGAATTAPKSKKSKIVPASMRLPELP